LSKISNAQAKINEEKFNAYKDLEPCKWDEDNNEYIPITTLQELIEWNAFRKHYSTPDNTKLQFLNWTARKLGDLCGCEVDEMNNGDWAYFNIRLVVPNGSWTDRKNKKTVRYGHFYIFNCEEIQY